jgi:hypothetical protein
LDRDSDRGRPKHRLSPSRRTIDGKANAAEESPRRACQKEGGFAPDDTIAEAALVADLRRRLAACEAELAHRTVERDEALAQQIASAEILEIICGARATGALTCFLRVRLNSHSPRPNSPYGSGAEAVRD